MITLVTPGWVYSKFVELTNLDVETGAVLLCRPVLSADGDLRLLVTELHLVPDHAYQVRETGQLTITSEGYVPALGRAEKTETVPIWLHTHPGEGASPRASLHDEVVDEQLSDLFRFRSGSNYYGALILSPTLGGLRFSGFLESDQERTRLDRMFVADSRLHLFWHDDSSLPPPEAMFDRNIRAFGGEIQRVLHDCRVGIVGCGGTGSSVAEQLARLGVRHFVLVDPDILSVDNVTRVYGSEVSDVGTSKVDVIAKQIRRIAPNASVQTLPHMVTKEEVARRIAGLDIIFGCTDDNAGRLVLSRLSTYMLIPVFDCGVLLDSDEHSRVRGIFGRVTILSPGSACLVCRNRIDLARAATESLSPDERIRRVDEGYAPALPGVEPAVVAFTTQVASTAVAELIERLVAYGQDEVPSEVLLRIHDREISTNHLPPKPRHYCHPNSSKIGLGVTEPFLEQNWQS